MYVFFLIIAMSITHNTTIIVYRFTETLAEEFSWKPQEAATAAFLKWSAIILLPIVGVLILMDPSLVIAGIGPLGMGLMAGVMGSQQAKQSNSRHHLLDWPDTDKIYLYPGRDIIGLNIPWLHPDAHEVEPNGIREVYCRPACAWSDNEHVLNALRSRLLRHHRVGRQPCVAVAPGSTCWEIASTHGRQPGDWLPDASLT